MGIAGAALYSLVLIAGRKLVRLSSHAKPAFRSVRRLLLEGVARHGARLRAAPHTNVQRSISKQ